MSKTDSVRSPVSQFHWLSEEASRCPNETIRDILVRNAHKVMPLSPSQKAALAYRADMLCGLRTPVKGEFSSTEEIANYLHIKRWFIKDFETLCISGDEKLIKAVEEDRMAVRSAVNLLSMPEEERGKIADAAYKNAGRYRLKEAMGAVMMAELSPGKAVGVIRGHEAVNILKKIPKNDPQRERGFQIVRDFMRDNK